MQSVGEQPLSRSLRVYQKVAIVFVVVAFLLLLAVLYLSISQATIKIVPNTQVASTTVATEIALDPTGNQIQGFVAQKTVKKAKTFTLPEEGGVAVENKSNGLVTLINETDIDQPLVATTRLLSADDVLFRIDESTVVPANGKIDVIARADVAGASGDIGPTRFTIPGLPKSLQSSIYAVSVDNMIGGVQYVSKVEQSDLDQAMLDLKNEIKSETEDLLRRDIQGSSYNGENFSINIIEQVSDTEPGTETGSFNVSVTAKVTGLFYNKEDLIKYAEASLLAKSAKGFQIKSINKDGLNVSVQSVNTDKGVATVDVYLDGFAVIAQNNEILNVDRFTGRSPGEVITLLESADSIENVTVNFTPFWLKRIPTLKDHINITISDE